MATLNTCITEFKEADEFKPMLAALSTQSPGDRDVGTSSLPHPARGKEKCRRPENQPGRQCLNSNKPFMQEVIPHPGSARLPACCRCSHEKLRTHFSAEQTRVCVSWMEAAV